ncbi:hypothetical protein [Phocaeicola vulgatus]|nr:hypothetical protein [Phocaeicola vulgatus]
MSDDTLLSVFFFDESKRQVDETDFVPAKAVLAMPITAISESKKSL